MATKGTTGDQERRDMDESFRAMQAAGGTALRGLFVINAGAFVSMLGMLAVSDNPEKILVLIISLFGFGAAISVASACLAYEAMFWNYMRALSHNNRAAEEYKKFIRGRNKAHSRARYFGWFSLAMFVLTIFLFLLSQIFPTFFPRLYKILLSILELLLA